MQDAVVVVPVDEQVPLSYKYGATPPYQNYSG